MEVVGQNLLIKMQLNMQEVEQEQLQMEFYLVVKIQQRTQKLGMAHRGQKFQN